MRELQDTITGNGARGMDERVRALEAWREDHGKRVKQMQRSLAEVQKSLARFSGGLAVAVVMTSLGLGGIAWALWRIYAVVNAAA